MNQNSSKRQNGIGESAQSYRASVDCQDCTHGRPYKHRRAVAADEAAIEDGMDHARATGHDVEVVHQSGRVMPITAVQPATLPENTAFSPPVGGDD